MKMDFVALISGGKDSLFSIMEAVTHGYRLRAVVHLSPKMGKYGAEEQDSYMYQSVASEGVELLAKALNVPLISLQISGVSTCKQTDYIGHQNDEVEDLYRALSQAMSLIPSLRFVSSGAILSDYQRIRVEHVAARLGLRSLAFLWRRSQDLLLEDMINADLDAIIVKVASFGLRADRHLGQHLRDVRSHLLQLAQSPFQLNVCGEGGEYETFTLDCPLFEQRICLQSEPEPVVHSEDELYPVVYLRLTNLCLQPKSPDVVCHTRDDLLAMKWRSNCDQDTTGTNRRPFLNPTERLVDLDRSVLDEIAQDYVEVSYNDEFAELLDTTPSTDTLKPTLVSNRVGSMAKGRLWITKMCVGVCVIEKELDLAVSEATQLAVGNLLKVLSSLDCSTDQVVHCWAILNQALTPTVFDAFNAVYVSEFGLPWELRTAVATSHANRVFPPTRACVVVDPFMADDGTLYQSERMAAVGLIMVLCPLSGSDDRPALTGGPRVRGMHVRSLSHWAPANIGPYSQALSIRLGDPESAGDQETRQLTELEVTFYSGQIGLVPETLTLINRTTRFNSTEPDVCGQCLLALRHCHRVMKAHSTRLWHESFVAICFGTSSDVLTQARQTFHQAVCCSAWGNSSDRARGSGKDEDRLCACEQRVIFVLVTDLPKQACVEWQWQTISRMPHPTMIVAYGADLHSLCSLEGGRRRTTSLLFVASGAVAPLPEISRVACPIIPCCGFLDRTEPFAALFL